MTRAEMVEKLEQYKMGNGYYDILAIENDENDGDELDNTFAAFFGDVADEEQGAESELIALARELNEQMANAKHEAEDTEATKLIAKTQDGTATREDWERLVKLSRAYCECLPDGITYTLNRASGTAYSDQTGTEEDGGLH